MNRKIMSDKKENCVSRYDQDFDYDLDNNLDRSDAAGLDRIHGVVKQRESICTNRTQKNTARTHTSWKNQDFDDDLAKVLVPPNQNEKVQQNSSKNCSRASSDNNDDTKVVIVKELDEDSESYETISMNGQSVKTTTDDELASNKEQRNDDKSLIGNDRDSRSVSSALDESSSFDHNHVPPMIEEIESGQLPSVEWVPYVTDAANYSADGDVEGTITRNPESVGTRSVVTRSESSSAEEGPHVVNVEDVILAENDEETRSVQDGMDNRTVYSGSLVKETSKWNEPAAKLCRTMTKGRLTLIFLSIILLPLVLVTCFVTRSKSTTTLSAEIHHSSSRAPSTSPSLNSPTSAQAWTKIWTDIEGEKSYEAFGKTVSLTYDGDRLYAGGKNTLQVYELTTNNGQRWANVEKLNLYFDSIMESMSISSDGKHLIVGDILHAHMTGAMMVFRQTSVWCQKGESITGSKLEDMFGNAVAISDNGHIITGGSGSGGYVFVYGWDVLKLKWIKMMEAFGQRNGRFGDSLSMSGDGSKLIIGEPGFDAYIGAVHVYEELSLSCEKINVFAENNFGEHVAMSTNGRQVAIASENVVRRFRLDIDPFLEHGDKVIVPDMVSSLALSFNGARMMVGNKASAKAYVFESVGNDWSEIGEFSGAKNTEFGTSLMISGTGNRVAIGTLDGDHSRYKSGHVEIYEYGL